MPWFELRPFKRVDGAGLVGDRTNVITFEAADENAAKAEGYRRAKAIAGADVVALADEAGDQVSIWDVDAV